MTMSRRSFLQSSGASLATIPTGLSLRDKALTMFVDRLDTHLKSTGPQLTLIEFVQQAWRVMHPEQPFVPNWHIEAICGHLQAVSTGAIQRLLVNVPPGTGKSEIVSVLWNCWEWTRDPSLTYLCASYDQQLSIRDNVAVRNIIGSEWYQSNWPQVALADDQNQKLRFATTRGGYRIGTSVGGRATGEHPRRKVIDDPHNVKKSSSKTDRESVINWYKTTLSTRGAGLNAATVLIMQRLAAEDLSGWILDNQADQWTHLMLPMRHEPDRHCSTSSMVTASRTAAGALVFSEPQAWTDPRTEKNELLWPAFLNQQKVDAIARDLGPYGDAGQYQQRPSPEGGGMFKREDIQFIDAIPAAAHVVARCRAWDCAATEGGGDHTASVLMSIVTDGRVYVESVLRGQWGPASFEGPSGLFVQTVRMDPPWTRQREEEEGGSSGKKVTAQHAQWLHGYDYLGVRSTGDKATRARPFRAQTAVHNVYIVRTGDRVRDAWIGPYLDELCNFREDGSDQVDDQVDASSLAYNEIALNVIQAPHSVAIQGW